MDVEWVPDNIFAFFFSRTQPAPRSALFPYTTLFRSRIKRARGSATSGPAPRPSSPAFRRLRSEEHTSELQSRGQLVCRLLLEKKKFVICVAVPAVIPMDFCGPGLLAA